MAHTCADRPNLPCLACCNNDPILYAKKVEEWRKVLMEEQSKGWDNRITIDDVELD